MVPSLVSCCLNLLVPFADEIELPVTLRLRPHDTLLDDLVPDPAELDPKLWAVLVQVYDALPPYFRTLTLPLASPHVSLLQKLAPTPNFSLITLLNLTACSDLTDESILLFKSLHTLVGLDASSTTLTSHAIYTLGAILQHNYGKDAVRHHRGPWELRILSLRHCKQIDDDVYPYLNKFPLLAVVDLRGTRCNPPKDSPFNPWAVSTFHHPTSMADSIAELQTAQPDLFLSNKPYVLKVDKMKLPQVHRRYIPDVAPKDAFVVIPANPFRPVKVGNTNVLELQKQKFEEREKYEQNKEAWYERQERLEERQFNMTDDDFSDYGSDDLCGEADSVLDKYYNNDGNNACNPALSTSTKPVGRLCIPRLHTSRQPAYNARAKPNVAAKDAPAVPNPTSSRFGVPEYRIISRPNPVPTSHAQSSTTPNSLPLGRRRGQNPYHFSRGAVVGPLLPVGPLSPERISSSSTTSFYSVPPPRMAKSKPPVLRKVEDGDPALKLYREPPPYSNLSSALARSLKRTRASSVDNGEYGDKSTSDRPSKESLKKPAQVDQTSTRAERARNAMQLALQSRMPSSVASSSKTPVDRSDLPFNESVLKKRRHIAPSFESSFPPEVLNADKGNAPTRSRNPFRKSLPSQSAMAGFIDPPVFNSSVTSKPHQVVESPTASRKAAHRHSISNSTLTATSTPLLRPSRSVADLRSSDFSTASASTSSASTTTKVGYRPASRPPSPPNTKPLVPISSFKIPVLPEPLRKEVAAMEKAEIAKIKRAAERKRKKRTEAEDDDATDSDDAELKRALKKRASLAKIGVGAKKDGRATDASTSETKPDQVRVKATEKGKGKVSTGKQSAFDWKGWAKK